MKNDNTSASNTLTPNQVKTQIFASIDAAEKAIASYNRRCGNRLSKEICEDLAVDACMQACDKIHTYNPQKASVRTWLGQIAHNLAYNTLSRELRKVLLDFDRIHNVEEDEEGGVGTAHLCQEERDQLLLNEWEACEEVLAFEARRKNRLQRECFYKALASLGDKDQVLIYMRVEQHKGGEEMAEELGMSHGALRVAFSRALKAFKLALDVRHFKDVDEHTSLYFWEESSSGLEDGNAFWEGRSDTNG